MSFLSSASPPKCISLWPFGQQPPSTPTALRIHIATAAAAAAAESDHRMHEPDRNSYTHAADGLRNADAVHVAVDARGVDPQWLPRVCSNGRYFLVSRLINFASTVARWAAIVCDTQEQRRCFDPAVVGWREVVGKSGIYTC